MLQYLKRSLRRLSQLRLSYYGIRTTFAVLIIIIGFSNSPVNALTDNQLDVLNSDIGYFNTETCVGNTTASGDVSLDGYTLPADHGKTAQEQAIDDHGNVIGGPDNGNPVRFSTLAAKLPQIYRKYYIAMRWKYTSFFWSGKNTGIEDKKQFDWMASQPRLVLVTNPANKKSVVVTALEEGPAPWTGYDATYKDTPQDGWQDPENGTPLAYAGRVSGLSPDAFKALDATTGTQDGGTDLVYTWADQTSQPGPVDQSNLPPVSDGGACGNATASSTGSTVFISQRDPLWLGHDICWGSADHGGCASVYSEGCWATSVAMIISSFTGHPWPDVVTPMQTEGNSYPRQNFDNNHLKDVGYSGHNIQTFRAAMAATQQGALVLIHGSGASRDGGPFYNTPTHWEVVRGITADGNILLNDPWDLPAMPDHGVPVKTGHTLKEWPERDVFPYTLDFQVITRSGAH